MGDREAVVGGQEKVENSPALARWSGPIYETVVKHRPDVERQNWLYSMEKSRAIMRRRQGKRPGPDPTKTPIPDNSEPWLPGGVRSVADALWISDRIKETAQRWGIKMPPQS